MRYLYLLGLAMLTQMAHGQAPVDTLALASVPEETSGVPRRVVSSIDSTGLCSETLSWGGADALVRSYYASGRLKEYVPYANFSTGHIHGLVTTWYESGQLASRQPFVGGRRDGVLELYYENGQLKRRTPYEAGAELPGRCFDAAGRAVPYATYEQLPLYPGGQMQLAKEINKAMRWPRDVPTLIGYDQRTVCISFLVDKDGTIRQPQIAVSSQFPSLDRAILNSVGKLARRFTPGRRDGSVVLSRYYLPIQLNRVAYYQRPATI